MHRSTNSTSTKPTRYSTTTHSKKPCPSRLHPEPCAQLATRQLCHWWSDCERDPGNWTTTNNPSAWLRVTWCWNRTIFCRYKDWYRLYLILAGKRSSSDLCALVEIGPQENQLRFPTFFLAALDYLAIQGSAVPCERVFSSAKETMTERHNCIHPDLMEMLQMLKFAMRSGEYIVGTLPHKLEAWLEEQNELLDEVPDGIDEYIQTLLSKST